MTLSDKQQAAVRSWVEAGDGLAEVQRKLQSEFGLKLTFLDTRFLVDDLALSIQSPERPQEPEPEAVLSGKTPDAEAGLVDEHGNPASKAAQAGGGVSVSLDEVQIPGTMVSGKATFSDGQSGRWYIDEMGRMGFEGSSPGYRPSEEDLVAFQQELQKLMRSQGF